MGNKILLATVSVYWTKIICCIVFEKKILKS